MIDVGSAYFCCDECPISEDVERRYRNANEAGVFNMTIADVIKSIFLSLLVGIVGMLSARKIILNEPESARLVRRIEEKCA